MPPAWVDFCRVLVREKRDDVKQISVVVIRVLNLLEDNRLCEETLLELIGGPETTRSLAQAESEQFNNEKCEFLWSEGLVLDGLTA
jgi:hypothetical protein